ncbi:MAG: hypothetical protein ACOYKZ_00420 [Chlamydiia bacterium]
MAIVNSWAWTEVTFYSIDGLFQERLGSTWTSLNATSRCHEVCKLAFDEFRSLEASRLQQIDRALDWTTLWSRRKTVGVLDSDRTPVPFDLDNSDFLWSEVPNMGEILVIFHA